MCRLKILVVDDEHTTQNIISAILKSDEVICVDSGEEAIAAAQMVSFDVVLMDMSMPGIGGVEATRQMLAEGWIKYPSRIWAISAHHDDDVVDSALAAGCRDYFFKPIRPKFLVDRLKTVRESIDLYHLNQKEKKRWQEMFHLLPDPATFTDATTGKYLDVNKAFLDYSGLTLEQVIGQTPMSLGIISEYERKRFYRELKKTGTLSNWEIVYRKPDGTPFFGAISARIIKNGTEKILSVTRDETERKALQAQTQEQAGRLRGYDKVLASLQEVASATDEVIAAMRATED